MLDFTLFSLIDGATQIITSLINQQTQLKFADKQLELERLKQELQQSFQREQFDKQKQLQQELALLTRETQLKVADKQLELERLKQELQQSFQREQFDQQKQLQQELALLSRETQLEIAAKQRETTLKLPEVNKIFDNWPLRIFPSLILNSHTSNTRPPLRIIIAPPEVNFDKFGTATQGLPKMENTLAQGLRQFLSKNYPLHSQIRPIEFLDGAWDSNKYHGGASIKVLFEMLKSEPLLILQSEIEGDYLNFRVAYWGYGQTTYSYDTVLARLPYREIVYASAKARAKQWKPVRDMLIQQGKDARVINELDTYNLEILEEEEQLQGFGVDISQLPPRYKPNNKDFDALCQFLITIHALVAGLITDAHYLIHYDVSPLLPQLLPELIKEDVELQLIGTIVSVYQAVYRAIENQRSAWIPELALDLANSLSYLPDQFWAREQFNYSVQYWLKLRGVTADSSNLLESMCSVSTLQDKEYLDKLSECLARLGDTQGVGKVAGLLIAVQEAQRSQQLQEEKRKQQLQEEERKQQLQEEERRRQLQEEERRPFFGKVPQVFQFDLVTVNATGKEIKREKREAKYFTEDFGRGVNLEMVPIPGGTFLMGAPATEKESSDSERPQHQVSIQPFFMGKYPVTQAQWRVVAALPQVERELEPDPSCFKGDNLPVEQISWYDAVEFCKRLSKETGQNYRLPSEAEWEYACRAGTSTPFHFGETITPKLANYDGTYTYGAGDQGEYRGETTVVGSFKVANAFGLYDMHGNIWEWCADDTYDNYEDAPFDGAAWLNMNNYDPYSVLRGGSWIFIPRYCRSASRSFSLRVERDFFINNIGFRVVCAAARI